MAALAVACILALPALAGAGADDSAVVSAILSRVEAEPLTVPALRVGAELPPYGAGGRSGLSLLSLPVWAHRTLISPQDGDRCVFEPSCSSYAAAALRARGVAGWPMAADRILRCHEGAHGRYPFEDGRSLDPVPASGPSLSLVGGAASLIPGLGQWLAGDRGDAVYALGSVALLTWGSVHDARQDEPAPAVALGGLGAFFYVGAVYGGARAAARSTPR